MTTPAEEIQLSLKNLGLEKYLEQKEIEYLLDSVRGICDEKYAKTFIEEASKDPEKFSKGFKENFYSKTNIDQNFKKLDYHKYKKENHIYKYETSTISHEQRKLDSEKYYFDREKFKDAIKSSMEKALRMLPKKNLSTELNQHKQQVKIEKDFIFQ
eukprot:gene5694-9514_t